MSLQVGNESVVDLAADQRVIEQRRADTDRAGAGNQKFNGIFGAGDAALADDGNAVRFADLVDLVDLEYGDGLDGGTGKASLIVADNRFAGVILIHRASSGSLFRCIPGCLFAIFFDRPMICD